MHRGIFKRAGCVLLIVIMCFGLAAPAFAYTLSTDPTVKNSFYSAAQQFEVAWDYFMENESLTDELIDAFNFHFVDFSTSSDADYIGYNMYEVNEWVKDLSRQDFNLADFMHWTYVPGTGYYIFCFQSEPLNFATRFGEAEEKVRDFCNLIGIDGLAFAGASFGQKPLTSPYMAGGSFEGGGGASRGEIVGSAGTPHDYYINQSDTQTTINSSNQTTNTTIYNGGNTYTTETFDYSNGTWYDNVTGTVNDIETLYYSPSNDTYTVNNTYNITYEYNYTYYYNLGSSENLVQDYKFYYELPDGRSSSDLTADEIAGLSLEFDVVNYAEDRTDENTKILVPFDGSWEDTAYNGPELIWRTGASITYKESAAFNGALYIDGSNPSIFGFGTSGWYNQISTQGMTLQFRYYCDAFQTSNTYQNQSLIFSPFSYVNGSRYALSFPYYYVKPNGQIWFGVGNSYSTQIGNNNYINVQVGSLSGGVWTDICVSVVPQTGGRLNIVLYLNGQLVHSYSWPPSSYSGSYTPSFYPVFGFNVQTLVFRTLAVTDSRFVSSGISYSSNPEAMPYQMIDNLRVVDFALYDGSNNSNFVPTPVPFDTNLVYVLPDTTNLKDNTIAVQSGVPVSGYRIGGVRPTFPDEGMVWMPLENDKIADCQIYNGSYWESVGCRVWTGERWVPAWAFNVITLSDLWDMYGGEDSDNYTEITPGSFYQWFQQQFLELKTTITNGFNRILEALGVQVEGEEDITQPDADGNAKFSLLQLVDRILAGVTKVPAEVLSKALGSISETVGGFVTGVTDFFGGVEDMGEQSQPFFESMDGVLGNASQLVHDTWEAIPEDAQNVLSTCFMLAVFGSCIVIFLG